MKYRVIVLAVLSLVLTACGGGGGSETSSTQNPSSGSNSAPATNNTQTAPNQTNNTSTTNAPATNQTTSQSTPTLSNTTPATTGLSTTIDNDTMSFVSARAQAYDKSVYPPLPGSLRFDREIASPASVNLTLASAAEMDSPSLTYKITFGGGSVPNGSFDGGKAILPNAEGVATSFDQEFGAYKPTQYNAVLVPSTMPSTIYGISIQSLAQNGFTVGMGHWKYLGPYQTGYFEGYQLVYGSFVIGTPTPVSGLGNISSASYAGYAQGGLEASQYYNDFNELKSNVQVAFDKATGTVTIELKDFQVWTNAYMHPELPHYFHQTSPSSLSFLPASLKCTTTIDPNTNAFSCTLPSGSSVYTGTFKGKFFGQGGNEIAGTFAIKGIFVREFNEVTAGAFVVKKN